MDVHAILYSKNQRENHFYLEEQQSRSVVTMKDSGSSSSPIILSTTREGEKEKRASGRREWMTKEEEERDLRQKTLSTLLLPLIYRHELRSALKCYSTAVEVRIIANLNKQ